LFKYCYGYKTIKSLWGNFVFRVMKFKEFFNLIENGVRDLFRKPFVIFPGLVFFLFLFGFSNLGGKFGYLLQTTPTNVAWIIGSVIVLLGVGGFISAGLIGLCVKIVRKEKVKDAFFSSAKKFWFRNFLVLVLFLVFFNLINLTLFLFTKFMISVSGTFSVSASVFRILSMLITFVWIAGIIIFFTFSNFYTVGDNLGVGAGIRKSRGLVRKEYPATLSLSVILFVVVFLVGKISGVVVDLINYGVVLPLTFLIFTRFVIEFGK